MVAPLALAALFNARACFASRTSTLPTSAAMRVIRRRSSPLARGDRYGEPGSMPPSAMACSAQQTHAACMNSRGRVHHGVTVLGDSKKSMASTYLMAHSGPANASSLRAQCVQCLCVPVSA